MRLGPSACRGTNRGESRRRRRNSGRTGGKEIIRRQGASFPKIGKISPRSENALKCVLLCVFLTPSCPARKTALSFWTALARRRFLRETGFSDKDEIVLRAEEFRVEKITVRAAWSLGERGEKKIRHVEAKKSQIWAHCAEFAIIASSFPPTRETRTYDPPH